MIDFSLTFSDIGEQSVPVRAASLQAGEAAGQLPATSKSRLRSLIALAPYLLTPYSRQEALEEYGKQLFNELVSGCNRDVYLRAKAIAKRDKALLRVRLKYEAGWEFEALPFEVFHDGDRFLAEDAGIAVVRHIAGPPEPTPPAIGTPLRVLFTFASPREHPSLDFDSQMALLKEAYSSSGSRVEIVPHRDVSRTAIEGIFRDLRQGGKPFHVWHHCGHGGLVRGNGDTEFRLYLEADGDQRYATTEQLRVMIGDRSLLQLVVLSVCFGASPGGPAPDLARLNVPAVVGFPLRIEAGAVGRFAQILHGSLLRVPLEQAVSEARVALFAQNPTSRDWCHMRLFLRREADLNRLCQRSREDVEGSPKYPDESASQSAEQSDVSVGPVYGKCIEINGLEDTRSHRTGRPVKSTVRVDSAVATEIVTITGAIFKNNS